MLPQGSNPVDLAKVADTDHYQRFSTYLVHSACTLDDSKSALANLVLAETIGILEGDRQCDLALRVLNAIQPSLKDLPLHQLQGIDKPTDELLLKEIFVRGGSDAVKARIFNSVIGSFRFVGKPVGHAADWLSEQVRRPPLSLLEIFWTLIYQSGKSGMPYKQFAIRLYGLINSSTLHPHVSRQLLQSLFVQLGEETLTFLASVWTLSISPAPLRVSALRHALAFISAFSRSEEKDFQMVLPAMLVAMQDSVKEVSTLR